MPMRAHIRDHLIFTIRIELIDAAPAGRRASDGLTSHRVYVRYTELAEGVVVRLTLAVRVRLREAMRGHGFVNMVGVPFLRLGRHADVADFLRMQALAGVRGEGGEFGA